MILPSILLWRSKRKDRISREKTNGEEKFVKAELDADEPQRPDRRVRELPGDMAHELRSESNENEVWELPGDTAHELGGVRHVNGIVEIPGDFAYELRSDRDRNGVRKMLVGQNHENAIKGGTVTSHL